MAGLSLVAYFFGGTLLANAVPHLVSGVRGEAFQSPFARPPGVGLSSASVNVLWAAGNLAVAYLLLMQVGAFNPRDPADAGACGAGLLAMALLAARVFGPLHGGAR